jgi:hypothetical protein
MRQLGSGASCRGRLRGKDKKNKKRMRTSSRFWKKERRTDHQPTTFSLFVVNMFKPHIAGTTVVRQRLQSLPPHNISVLVLFVASQFLQKARRDLNGLSSLILHYAYSFRYLLRVMMQQTMAATTARTRLFPIG